VQHLRLRHESGLLSRQIGGEVLMKLRGVEVGETVYRLLYCSRFTEVTWEAPSRTTARTGSLAVRSVRATIPPTRPVIPVMANMTVFLDLSSLLTSDRNSPYFDLHSFVLSSPPYRKR